MNVSRLGRVVPRSSALLLCDMQEKFRPHVSHFEAIVHNSSRVLAAATLMQLPTVIVTEQNPKALGSTVAELGVARQAETLGPRLHTFDKTCFSMLVPEVRSLVSETKSALLCGIETHACILHTAMDLLESGVDVHVLVDCCSSRSPADRTVAFRRLRQMGAFLTTSECAILGLAADSAHPKFRELQKLVREPARETGLLQLPF